MGVGYGARRGGSNQGRRIMNVLGLDLSLRSTGWAVLDYDTGALVDHGVIVTKADPERPNFHGRALVYIRQEISGQWIRAGNPDIGIERMPPIGGPRRGGHHLVMVHGAIQAFCAVVNVDPALPTVSEVKKHATGSGNADKAAMIQAAVDRWGVVLGPDEADAAWVASWTRCQMLDAIEAQT